MVTVPPEEVLGTLNVVLHIGQIALFSLAIINDPRHYIAMLFTPVRTKAMAVRCQH
jgi:hypothetical protein